MAACLTAAISIIGLSIAFRGAAVVFAGTEDAIDTAFAPVWVPAATP